MIKYRMFWEVGNVFMNDYRLITWRMCGWRIAEWRGGRVWSLIASITLGKLIDLIQSIKNVLNGEWNIWAFKLGFALVGN